jgi:hypothetical protein
MTIHATVRSPRIASKPVDLATAVRSATSRSGLIRLFAALGITCVPTPRPDPFLKRALAMPHVKAAWLHAQRGTLRIMVAELDEPTTRDAIVSISQRFRQHQPALPLVVVVAAARYETLTIACFSADSELRHLTLSPAAPLASDIDVLRDMIAAPDATGVEIAVRYANALDRKVVGARFFAQVRTQRDNVALAWTGLPGAATSERDQLALLFLCRLLFLYFLQRDGHLTGDREYIPHLVQQWQRERGARGSLYRDVLSPLFFGSLNTRPERRSAAARALGPLPYLNGGLFERHSIERRFPDLDLPDATATALFDDLLQRFRFTTTDAAASHGQSHDSAHIDPEMLGRVFENLMTADRRSSTGTYYTPPATVSGLTTRVLAEHLNHATGESQECIMRLVNDGEAAQMSYPSRTRIARSLREIRVLDPACGSGAFLLGALTHITTGRAALGEDPVEVRRDVAGRCLHGVDLLDDAALLCSLRLWLSLADTAGTAPPPLPNLDRRIRQGDALLDPLELLAPGPGSEIDARARRDRAVRNALNALLPLADSYLDAEPEQRLTLRGSLAAAEAAVGRAWLNALHTRLLHALRDAHARSQTRDLWDATPASARAAAREADRLGRRCAEVEALLAQIEDAAAVPFFSFRVHFAERSDFDVIVSNPPWVRAHRWPSAVGAAVRERYEVCQPSPQSGDIDTSHSRSAGQVDLSMLFLERSLSLLATGGTLGMLLPAKTLRSLYGGGSRALLLRTAEVCAIDDYSLDHHAVFRADAFTMAIIARKSDASRTRPADRNNGVDRDVKIRMIRRGVPPLEFAQPQHELQLDPADSRSPWFLAPPDVLAVLRRMQLQGRRLSQFDDLQIKRGIVTGANDVLVVREFSHKLGGLTHIRTDGYFRARRLATSSRQARQFAAFVETSALRPLVRGADIDAWRCTPSARVLWIGQHDSDVPRRSTPRLQQYLQRHEAHLRERTGISSSASIGSLMRVTAATLGHKVLWQDISDTLRAVAVPDRVRGDDGRAVPMIPLNSVYYVATPDADTALLLAAYMNALPARVFARAAAERAKDARFRFFAWTIGALPLPAAWRTQNADTVLGISRDAHAAGGLSRVQQLRLDAIVAQVYGLSDDHISALLAFDRWLSGEA